MNIRTYRERVVRRLLIGVTLAIVGLFVLLSVFDTSLRQTVLGDLTQFINQRTVQIVAATIGLGVLAILQIVDHIDQLRTVVDGISHMLGYDLTQMTKRGRAFGGIPEEYVSRPPLERELAKALAPANQPRLVVVRGERDAGKTTLLRFLVLRRLNRRYRARVIDCRGDRQSIEAGPSESDEQMRIRLARRVLARVIDQAGLPGDVGEAVSTMSEAIAEHFRREDKPWLIIIDQVEDGLFPFERVLPPLFGTRNTVVAACRHASISDSAASGYHGAPNPTRRELLMTPFTNHQAVVLLRLLCRRQHKRFTRRIARGFQPHLSNTSPGIIQRLSDAYEYDQASETIEQLQAALDDTSKATDEERLRGLMQLTIGQLTQLERLFVIALGLFDGETVATEVLRAVANRLRQVDDPSAEEVILSCVAHRYLRPAGSKRASAATQRYFITKLGRGMARALLLREGEESELRVGTAILDHYRRAARRRQIELNAALPNILGIMEWAQIPPRSLPERDIVAFTRLLRDVVYYAGSWDVGMQWLRYAMQIARREDLPLTAGDLATAHARILLGRGRPAFAARYLDEAVQAYLRAREDAEQDLDLGVGHAPALQNTLDYTSRQQVWLDHLRARMRIAGINSSSAVPSIEAIITGITAAKKRLVAPAAQPATQPVAHSLMLDRGAEQALSLDESEARIRLGDALMRGESRSLAETQWRLASTLLQQARQSAEASARLPVRGMERRQRTRQLSPRAPELAGERIRAEMLMTSWRLEGMLCRFRAAHGSAWYRFVMRRRGITHLRRALRGALQLGSRYDQALVLIESAQLAITGIPATHPSEQPRETGMLHRRVRALFCLASPRWHRLRTAAVQARQASGHAGALGAQVEHIRGLMALADISLRLWRLDRNPAHISSARTFGGSAYAIAQRLSEASPEISERLRLLPEWVLREPPQETTHTDTDAISA